ncbi:MAG: class I SAM-dependent methyltransferase [Burkholderiales bacterium]
MPLIADARVLLSLLCGLPRRGTHGERLQRFYGPQAARYDDFRERLLHGRQELIRLLPTEAGDRIVELGGGTGRNVDFFGPRLDGIGSLELVDLCQPLLDIAAARTAALPKVRLTRGDATHHRPDQPVDCVYFSYALTMIPDWRRAIDNAIAMLRPGGTLGIVDFYVSKARPAPGMIRHGWLSRTLWRSWFRHDGVLLSDEHLPYLQARLDTRHLSEHRAALPYLPGIKAPYYLFVGRKNFPPKDY